MKKIEKRRPILQLKGVETSSTARQDSIYRHAVRYALMGFAVLPLHGILRGACTCQQGRSCTHAGKHPRVAGGVNSASTDPSQIKLWWKSFPAANVGIATGSVSGLVVLDLDPLHGSAASFKSLKKKCGSLPRTPRAKTGGGGEHRYFSVPNFGVKTRHGTIGQGIDVQSDGAYVVAPPSRHISGKRYSWFENRTLDRASLKVLPGPWVEAIGAKTNTTTDKPFLHPEPGASAAGLAILDAELSRLRGTGPGKRNDALNKAAFNLGQLVPGGDLDRAVAERLLTQTGMAIGLDAAETSATIRSGMGAGEQAARDRRRNALDEIGDLDPLTVELAKLGETDADMGRRFARRYADKVIFTPGRGLLVYDGKVWSSDDVRQRYQLAEAAARLVAEEAALLKSDREKQSRLQFAANSLSKSALERSLELAKSHLAVEDSKLDRDPLLLNVSNGTLDLRTGIIRAHDPADHCTMLANASYEPAAKCPRFLAFLETALGGDIDLLKFVQKAAGLSLTGNIEEHVFFFVHGPGRTGKSTFVNLLRGFMGDYGKHTPTETLLAKHYDNAIPVDLARLAGVRMVTAVEANWNRAIDEARVKSMTGGEPITARYMRENLFEFRPQFKIWFVANDFPQVRGTAGAFWERAKVIPFTVEIAEDDRDRDLMKKLMTEASGILNWAIEGCLAWQHEGLGTCAAIKAAGGRWKKAADHVRKFVDAEIVRDPGNVLSASDLLDHYVAWCRRNGEEPLDAKKLKAKLVSFDFTHARTNTGSTWKGVKLRLT